VCDDCDIVCVVVFVINRAAGYAAMKPKSCLWNCGKAKSIVKHCGIYWKC